MSGLDVLFVAVGLLTAGAGLLAVTSRNVLHAALWLVVALGGLAVAAQAVGQSGDDGLTERAAGLLDRTRRELYRMLAEAEVAREDDLDDDEADADDWSGVDDEGSEHVDGEIIED